MSYNSGSSRVSLLRCHERHWCSADVPQKMMLRVRAIVGFMEPVGPGEVVEVPHPHRGTHGVQQCSATTCWETTASSGSQHYLAGLVGSLWRLPKTLRRMLPRTLHQQMGAKAREI